MHATKFSAKLIVILVKHLGYLGYSILENISSSKLSEIRLHLIPSSYLTDTP